MSNALVSVGGVGSIEASDEIFSCTSASLAPMVATGRVGASRNARTDTAGAPSSWRTVTGESSGVWASDAIKTSSAPPGSAFHSGGATRAIWGSGAVGKGVRAWMRARKVRTATVTSSVEAKREPRVVSPTRAAMGADVPADGFDSTSRTGPGRVVVSCAASVVLPVTIAHAAFAASGIPGQARRPPSCPAHRDERRTAGQGGPVPGRAS